MPWPSAHGSPGGGGERAFGRAGLMRFRILGPLEVLSPITSGRRSAPPSGGRCLPACCCGPGSSFRPTSLILELWGDSPPGTANNLVSIYVHRLKKVIGDTEGKLLVYRAPGYMLRLAPGDIDLEHFESPRRRGRGAAWPPASRSAPRSLLAAGARAVARPAARRRTADIAASATQADRAAELWLTTTELRVAGGPRVRPGGPGDTRAARAGQGAPDARAAVGSLIRALEEAGRRAEALETYAQARQVIADELGVDPGAELQRLYAELLAADASSAPAVAQRPITGDAPAFPTSGAAPGVTAAAQTRAVPGSAPHAPGGRCRSPASRPEARHRAAGSIASGTCRGRPPATIAVARSPPPPGGRGTGQLATAAPGAAPGRHRGLHRPRGAGRRTCRDAAGPGGGGAAVLARCGSRW